MQSQSTSTILMIRPVRFSFNQETAESNAFQDINVVTQNADKTQIQALQEFDEMVKTLQMVGVEVLVFEDTAEPHTPDSIFPNNWVSFHQSGKICLYPMQAENRRLERRNDIIDALGKDFHVEEVLDFTDFEQEGKYLEGTGSLVLDRINRIAYACISPRTNQEVLKAWAKQMNGYKVVTFHASDANGKAIYHTNVLMCVGDTFAVVCLNALSNSDERLMLKETLAANGKHIIEISMEQMNHFAGNMLLIKNKHQHKLLVMSTQAFESLLPTQQRELESYSTLLHFNLETIEANGGGSARCMMAEVHLPRK